MIIRIHRLCMLLGLLVSIHYVTVIACDSLHDIRESIFEPGFPDRIFSIVDYGAIGDGNSDALPAIQLAINDANGLGGGFVLVPEGIWLSNGPIHLKSNINLVLEGGALLLFSPDPDYYLPPVLTRWEGTEVFNYSPLIYAYNAINVAISGTGTIIGSGGEIFSTWRDKQGQDQSLLREMGAQGVPVQERVFGKGNFLRPNMIQFFSCQNVLLEGITIKDSPMWVNHFIYSTNVIMRDVTVDSHRLNNDGVVIESSSNVLIEGNSFHTGDDSIVIKSGRDQDAWRVGRPSQNIIIKNNTMQGYNAIAFGSEMSGGIRCVYVENNRMIKVRNAVYFKSNLDRGGIIENIRVRHVNIGEAESVVRFRTDYHGYRGDIYPPLFQDIIIEDVTCDTAHEVVIEARGTTEAGTIRDVLIRNIIVHNGVDTVSISGVINFKLENIMINNEIYNKVY
jgi:polygalacturonase